MSGGLIDKVYIGLDNAPAAFDIKGRILGPNGTNLDYIRSETGVVAVLKADKFEPLHLSLHHTRSEALSGARSLALNLIETVRAELAQWSAAQAGGPPPPLNVPPPTLASTGAPPPVPPPSSVTFSQAPTQLTAQPQIALPPPGLATSTPLMTVRQPTVLQLLPQQQQYVLNQENGQLIPIVQSGVQMQNNFGSLPIQQLGGQHFGTQLVDLNMQPMNVTQLRLSGVPSSMSMILPNGLSFPQAQLSTSDTTTVSSATSTPVVCAAPSNSAHKILYSTDKDNNTVQWAMPGSQTMLIPYQQLQELTNNQNTLGNLQQQFVSIAPAGGLQQTSLPLSAAQLQQIQATGGTIMHLNQKPIVSSGSLINIISTGQASSPHILSSASTPTKHIVQESRGQKRLSDGTPNQLQLRPIAPAGSHVSQDKSSSRDSRTWTTSTGSNSTANSMGMKINPAHGTIIHVSSGQQTNVSASGTEATGMYIRQNAIQVQTKDGQKQDLKQLQTSQNVQMITVPQGMTVLQNPLNITQMPMLGQQNSQVYMIPANHPNLVQGMSPGIIGQQVLQPGQNVTVMQPNQFQPGVQYNVPIMNMPMNMQQNTQYMPGINLNTQLSAQQINALTTQQITNANALAGQQLTNANINNLPIVQAPPPTSALTPQIPITQPPPTMLPNYTPTSQYANMPPQYMMQTNPGSVPTNAPTNYNGPNVTVPPNPPPNYNMNNQASTTPNNANGSNAASESESTNGNTQSQYNNTSPPQDYQNQTTQNFNSETSVTQSQSFTQNQTATTQSNYTSNTTNQTPNYSHTTSQAAVSYNNSVNQNNTSYSNATPPTTQTTSNSNYSPSTTPAMNSNYGSNNMQYPPNNQNQNNPYPNATGQNLAAYANNQYQYNSRPWFRPRYPNQGSNYAQPPPPAGPIPVPPPNQNYNYWQDS